MKENIKSNDIDKTLNRAKTIFSFGIVLVVIAPFIFTRQFLWDKLNFHDTGQIGDTIGGITAPIVNLIAAILIYYALKAQIQANRIIQFQIDNQKNEEINRKKLQYISDKTNLVRDEIRGFAFSYTSRPINSPIESERKYNFEGSEAINEFLDKIRLIGETHEEDAFVDTPKLTELYNLLEIINSLLDSIVSENISNEDRYFYKSILAFQYSSKIRPSFTAHEKYRSRNVKPCEKCGKRHSGIPDKIFDLIDLIDDKIK